MSAETPKTPRLAATRRPATGAPVSAPLDSAHCSALSRAGKPCGATPMRGEAWCYQHNPNCAEQARADRIRAANTPKAPRAPKPPEPASWHLETADDVRLLLQHVMAGLLRNQMDRNRANALCYAAQVALRAIDIAALEKRIAALEESRRPKAKGR